MDANVCYHTYHTTTVCYLTTFNCNSGTITVSVCNTANAQFLIWPGEGALSCLIIPILSSVPLGCSDQLYRNITACFSIKCSLSGKNRKIIILFCVGMKQSNAAFLKLLNDAVKIIKTAKTVKFSNKTNTQHSQVKRKKPNLICS